MPAVCHLENTAMGFPTVSTSLMNLLVLVSTAAAGLALSCYSDNINGEDGR